MPKKKPAPKPITLNSEQQEVASFRRGVLRCLAGAGAGKSSVLIGRFVQLVQEGVSPDDILCLSFTKGAAKNLRDRAEEAVGVQKMDRVAGFVTFHSLALSFCAQEREHFPFKLAEHPLALEPVANRLSSDAAKKFEVDPKALRPWVGVQRRNRVSAAQAVKTAEKDGKDEKMALAYKAYDRALREQGLLDFDSLLYYMVDLLESKPEVRSRWVYDWIMTDESQDNSPLEWRLLQLIHPAKGSLVCVGDPGQSVFQFRGSSSDLFLNMGRLFPETHTLYLGCNYRSTPQIVDFCRPFHLVPELAARLRSMNPEGAEPVITGYAGSADEAEDIVRKVDDASAILCRTNRGLRAFEDALSLAGKRYYHLSKSGFWQQPEVKAVVAYLACIVSLSDGSVLGALHAPFWPSRYIKKTELAAHVKKQIAEDNRNPSAYRVLTEYRSPDASQTKAVSGFLHCIAALRRYANAQPHDALRALLKELKAEEHYEDEGGADNNPRENLAELLKISQRFSSVREFLDYTRRVSAASKNKKGIALGTIHASKGLQWPSVFVVSVCEGMLPHARAESLEEEKNLLFVALSRAETHLHVSYAGTPSRFLVPCLPNVNDVEEVFEGGV